MTTSPNELIGKRVRLIKAVDNWPDAYVPSQEEGIVTKIDVDDAIWVLLDTEVPGLKDWDNQLCIFDWKGDDGPEDEDRAISYVQVIA